MMSGKAAAMFLGFAFWLLAARVAPAAHVGLTASATAAIMLVTLLASSGLGPASIVHYHRGRSSDLVDTVITLAVVAGLAAGVGFLVFAGGFLSEMDAIATDPLFAAAFVVMSVLGTVGVVFDQVSMAQRRGTDILVRNVTNGLITLVVPAMAMAGLVGDGASILFLGWVIGSASAVVIGAFHLHSTLGRWSRARLRAEEIRPVLRSSIGNQLLTMAERAPGLILPLVVTEVLSPEQNAFWYTSWMIAWGVMVVPLSTSTALFAELCAESADRRRGIRTAVRSALLIGIVLAACVVVAAPYVLRLAGTEYADAGTAPLRILVTGVLPAAAIYPYYAVARSCGRIAEAVVLAAVTAVAGIAAAATGGVVAGLTAMAAGWVAVLFAAGLVAALRLRAWSRPSEPGWRVHSRSSSDEVTGQENTPPTTTGP